MAEVPAENLNEDLARETVTGFFHGAVEVIHHTVTQRRPSKRGGVKAAATNVSRNYPKHRSSGSRWDPRS